MKKLILFCITITFLSPFGWHSFCWGAAATTLDDFKNSSFIKKYSQSKPMESWPLKTGGNSYSFTFDLKIDKNSIVLMEILTRGNNSMIYRYSLIFHASHTKRMKAFFNDLIGLIDSSLDSRVVTDYIEKRASVKLTKSSDAPKKVFGKYSFRVSNVLNGVTVSIERGENANKNAPVNVGGKTPSGATSAHLNSQSDRYASDDEVYRKVKTCMDLQYSLRPDWVPSDTIKAALCVYNAKNRYGEQRVKKMIKLWINQPHSIEYMTLFTEEQIALLNKALSLGIKKEKLNMPDLVIANATLMVAQSGK